MAPGWLVRTTLDGARAAGADERLTVGLKAYQDRFYSLAAKELRAPFELVKEVAATLADLGVQRSVDAVPAMLLGSVSLTPIEVAQVYQTLAAAMFLRARYLLELALSSNPDKPHKFRLPIQEIFVG